jgi:co-chaperonin GroES (HSP10)
MKETMKSSLSGTDFFIPDSTRARSNEAVVEAVGPGEWAYGQRLPIDLVKGDRVLFLRQGYTATISGVDYYVVTDRDILAKLENDEEATFTGAHIDEDVRLESLGRE